MDVKMAANRMASDIFFIKVCETREHTIDNIEKIMTPSVASFISVFAILAVQQTTGRGI